MDSHVRSSDQLQSHNLLRFADVILCSDVFRDPRLGIIPARLVVNSDLSKVAFGRVDLSPSRTLKRTRSAVCWQLILLTMLLQQPLNFYSTDTQLIHPDCYVSRWRGIACWCSQGRYTFSAHSLRSCTRVKNLQISSARPVLLNSRKRYTP